MKQLPCVLVLDDDKDLLEMVEVVLTNFKMQVYCLSDSTKLFEELERVKPSLLLMDIFLGSNDGRALCNQIKTDDDYSHIPVILYSAGNISQDSIEASMTNDFIPKPFDIKFLVDKIKSLMLNTAS